MILCVQLLFIVFLNFYLFLCVFENFLRVNTHQLTHRKNSVKYTNYNVIGYLQSVFYSTYHVGYVRSSRLCFAEMEDEL